MVVFKKLVYEWVLHAPRTPFKRPVRAESGKSLSSPGLSARVSALFSKDNPSTSLDSLIETPCVLEQL